jgi:uncharacterized membrane protein YhaH (DUF805 family)
MKSLLKFSFLFPLILFLSHQLTQKVLHLEISFIDYYLDPFCLTALFFPLLKIERKLLFDQKAFSNLELVIIFTFLVAIFEGLLPYFYQQFTSDIWDILAMALGLLWFVFFDSLKQTEYSYNLAI